MVPQPVPQSHPTPWNGAMGGIVKAHRGWVIVIGGLCALGWSAESLRAQESGKEASRVHVVITDAALNLEKDLPPLQASDLTVKLGKQQAQITRLVPAQGENAALQLMILIDDTLGTSIGGNLQEVKDFIKAQPPTTVVGVAYSSNTTIQLAQNFTNDHDKAAEAVRLPRGSLSSMDSPYLSLIQLVKSWPQQKVRRMVLMVSDGIDRLHGERPQAVMAGRGSLGGPRAIGTTYHSMPTMSADADQASEVAQRYNVVVSSLYAVGIGRAGRSSWDLQIGLSGLTQLADETGGECYSLSTSQAVSFKPYLDQYQKLLNNQYYLEFEPTPGKKGSLQRVKISTQAKNSEILAPDNVWVPGVAQ
ncbi:MAG TPA: hypothetical protein VKB38_18660 [Terracidiphilus sp.]|nr:hypothetical protein [Terracidiphilus sp.]